MRSMVDEASIDRQVAIQPPRCSPHPVVHGLGSRQEIGGSFDEVELLFDPQPGKRRLVSFARFAVFTRRDEEGGSLDAPEHPLAELRPPPTATTDRTRSEIPAAMMRTGAAAPSMPSTPIGSPSIDCSWITQKVDAIDGRPRCARSAVRAARRS